MWHIVWLSLIISLAINGLMFLIAFRLKSDKLTDISYAISFAAVALFAAWQANDKNSYALILTLMVCAWAARIGGFLLIRILRSGRDKRFDGVRENFIKFGRFWLGQALTAWLLLLPLEMAFSRRAHLGMLPIAGLIIWGSGLLIEALADYQKFSFKSKEANKGKWIASGLWSYSRHPNYFGEILVWIGIYVFSFTALSGWQRIAGLISPLFISVLLLFITGIPPLEKSANQRWGKLKAYQHYKARTSILVPLPKRG